MKCAIDHCDIYTRFPVPETQFVQYAGVRFMRMAAYKSPH